MPFCALQNFSALHITLTREATLCPNILNAIQLVVRISRVLCFHETKTKSKDFPTTLPNLSSNTFTIVGKVWRLQQSLFQDRFSQHDRTVEPVPIASFSMHSSSPLPHMLFWQDNSLQPSLPSPFAGFPEYKLSQIAYNDIKWEENKAFWLIRTDRIRRSLDESTVWRHRN